MLHQENYLHVFFVLMGCWHFWDLLFSNISTFCTSVSLPNLAVQIPFKFLHIYDRRTLSSFMVSYLLCLSSEHYRKTGYVQSTTFIFSGKKLGTGRTAGKISCRWWGSDYGLTQCRGSKLVSFNASTVSRRRMQYDPVYFLPSIAVEMRRGLTLLRSRS
jgi:hypothetical protein